MSRSGEWAQPGAVVMRVAGEEPRARLTLTGQQLPDYMPLFPVDIRQLRATLEAAKTEIIKCGGSVGILAIIEVSLEKL